MKKIICTVLCFLLLFSVAACTSGGSNTGEENNNGSTPHEPTIPSVVTNETYQSFWMKQHDYKTMPIAAFNAVPIQAGAYPENFVTEESYRILSESGINVAYALYDKLDQYPEDVVNALEYCEKYNV